MIDLPSFLTGALACALVYGLFADAIHCFRGWLAQRREEQQLEALQSQRIEDAALEYIDRQKQAGPST